MNYSDEELQRKIENKDSVEDSMDSKAYQKVFEALGQEPFRIPVDFADKVVKRLESRDSSLSKDHFWLVLGLITFIVATGITVVATDFKIDFNAFKFISGYSGLFVFSLAFILIIQYLDEQLVFRKMDL